MAAFEEAKGGPQALKGELEQKKWRLDEWRKFVANNSRDTYSLVVCLVILELYEHAPVKEREACHAALHGFCPPGLTGAQADMAIGFYLTHEVEGLPDPDMYAISGPKK